MVNMSLYSGKWILENLAFNAKIGKPTHVRHHLNLKSRLSTLNWLFQNVWFDEIFSQDQNTYTHAYTDTFESIDFSTLRRLKEKIVLIHSISRLKSAFAQNSFQTTMGWCVIKQGMIIYNLRWIDGFLKMFITDVI